MLKKAYSLKNLCIDKEVVSSLATCQISEAFDKEQERVQQFESTHDDLRLEK